jgi:hypothetical protein
MRTRTLNHFHTFYPDEQAEFDRLVLEERRLTRAKAAEGDDDPTPVRRRMSEPPEDIDAALEDVRARMTELREVIRSGVVRIVLKALPRKEFRRLLTEHPPREDVDLDRRLGYNTETFSEALIPASIAATRALAADGNSGETVPNEWGRWADDMSDGQYGEIFEACMELNTSGNPNAFPR